MSKEYKQPSWEETVEPSIPARFKKAKYTDIPKNIRDVFEKMKESSKGLFLYGEVGTGKTHIAYALHRSAPKSGIKSRFVNTVELFKDMRDEFGRQPEDRRRPTEELMAYEGTVIFDDVGVEKPTDFVVESLYLIINTRYNKMLPMIFTSNFDLDSLSDKVGDQIPSRIKEMCSVIELKGKDRRLKM